ncbi:MAG: peptidoglycan-binding protein, partial [Sphingomonadales bacterium]|nr:peptidoglycan-binding protein [Sphingomonadales bacterium]
MIVRLLVLAAILPITACQSPPEKPHQQPDRPDPNARFKALKFTDVPEKEVRFVPPAGMAVEVVLDRLGFSSGVIDGKATRLDKSALRGFQAASDLAETGQMDEATRRALAQAGQIAPTRLVRIPAEFAKGPFVPGLPREASGQAKYDHLGYRDLMEALAERFHTTPETLIALNSPGTKIGAGAVIRVPNVADVDAATLPADENGWNRTLMTLGVSPRQPRAAAVVVDKSDAVLRAY